MLSIYEADPIASFGYIGSNGMNEDTYCCTKRFRVYTTLMARYISGEIFYHVQNKSKSAYLMINRHTLKNNPNIVKESSDFFTDMYSYFE